MKKVGIIGHYGFGQELVNGQTIKTKILTEEIERVFGKDNVITIDTHGGLKAVISVIRGCRKCLCECENVIILLNENGLKVAVPILLNYNKKHKKLLHYVVIGGWLHKYLRYNRWLIKPLQKFDYIYVETSTMLKALKKLEFNNVIVMPNCKDLNILCKNDLQYIVDSPYRICTFSRVMEEKGIGDLVNVVKEINKFFGREIFILDIYGQIDANEKEWFNNIKKKFTKSIRYCGVVSINDSVKTIKNYYALIFPTKFYTEGIPGTIIDAYAAGVPVVSARWESFSDVIENGVTGIGYEFGNVEALKDVLINISNNVSSFNALKENVLERADRYLAKNVVKILADRL